MHHVASLNPSYVVLREHTLGFILPDFPDWMGVLHGSVLKGGHDWRNGPVHIAGMKDQMRPALKADFDEYGVCWRGHLKETDR
ncbi:hypothetical protein JYP52_21360 [Nitratireductor aquibiodomus]|uniref:hypothetical protein n=1 Tax=Nitratireductor aquibiodomus TaxID=204799 RepID=UPI0019D38322|nr:hypothetical protein [Nitratireductor aquibiodomus]MBN7763690.1 hypothetical protein [Nitratireductor aquibiodomus]